MCECFEFDKKRTALFLVLLGLALSFATTAWAQSSGSGTIQGRIVDQSGAVIVGTKITIRNTDTNVTRTIDSGDQGEYRVSLLQPGGYEVTAQATGLGTVKRPNIQLEVGSVATVNFELKVAGTEAVITVTDTAPITEPERTEVTNVVGQKLVEELPINGRRWDNFVLLTPGVSMDGTFGLISSRGISGLLNNNTVDGADNNQAFFSEARGRTRVAYTFSQTAIKEFQVGLSTFSAEFGRAAGGTINAVTKSGSNEWHGEVFYFIRDDSLQAREPTLRDPAGNALKNKDRRQQYGMGVGGPIVKDKLFFYGNFDQQLRAETYLTSASGGLFFSTFTTACNTAPSNFTAVEIAQLAANCTALQSFFLSQAVQNPRKRVNNVALAKLDWNINANNILSGSYNWHRWRSPSGIQTQQTLSRAASDNGTDGVKTDMVLVRLSSVLTSRMVNEAKFQWGRDFEFQLPNSLDPRTTITNGISFGMSEFLPRPSWPDERRFQWTDTLSWTVSRHTLKFGADINYVRGKTINVRNGGGAFSYTSLPTLAQDCPLATRPACTPINTSALLVSPTPTGKHYSSLTQAFDLRGLGGNLFFSTTDYNFFIQDTFKWTPRVTLNIGLRYEYQQLPAVPSVTIGGATFKGHPSFPETQKLNADTNNWGPRVSLAWDMGGNQKNVLRLGSGIYYGRTPNALVRSAILENGVALPTFTIRPADAGSPVYPAILSVAPTLAAARSVSFMARDYVRPFITMMDVAYERELSRNISVSVTYLFTRANRLTHGEDINLSAPTTTVNLIFDPDPLNSPTILDQIPLGSTAFYTGSRPLCDPFGAVPSGPTCTRLRSVIREGSSLNALYQGLIFQFTQRQRWGLTQTAHLTISKAQDDGQSMGASPFAASFDSFFDPQNRFREYARSDFDLRKRLVWYFIWQPDQLWNVGSGARKHALGDWSFNGIVTLQDGQPFTPAITVPSSALSSTCTSTSTAACATDTFSINGTGASSRPGWLPRNFLETPAFFTVDFRVQKDIRITESMKIRILWEAFNLLNRSNHANRFNYATTAYRAVSSRTVGGFANNTALPRELILTGDSTFAGIFDPVGGQGDMSRCTTANCLRSASGVLFGARDMQFGVKFIF